MSPTPHPTPYQARERTRARAALGVALALAPGISGCAAKNADASRARVDTTAQIESLASADTTTGLDSAKRSELLSVLRHSREIADSSREAASRPPKWAAPTSPAPAPRGELRIAGGLPAGAKVSIEGMDGDLAAGARVALDAAAYTVTLRVPGKTPVSGNVLLSSGRSVTWPGRQDLARLHDVPSSQPTSAVASSAAPQATPVRDTTRSETTAPPIERAPDTRSGGGATKPATTDNPAASGQEISSLLRQYATAYEARKIEDVTRIFPAMTSEEKTRWSAFFDSKDIQDLHAQVTGMTPPDVEGNTALVKFTLVLDYKMTGAGRQNPKIPYSANLRRGANGAWTIQSLDSPR